LRRISVSAAGLEKDEERREPPVREAEEEARRWPALMAVLWRVMSFSEGVSGVVTWMGEARGGWEVGTAAVVGGERW